MFENTRITLSEQILEEELVDCTITSDNYRAGVMVGEYFISRCKEADELISAIETVYCGQAMLNPDIAAVVLRLFSKMAQSDYGIRVRKDQIEELTKTEWKVVKQVGNGLSNKEIAQKLGFSENTVKNYLSNILDKLDLRDRTQIAIWAVQSGKNL